jgi:RNA polymerase-binding protein DksA
MATTKKNKAAPAKGAQKHAAKTPPPKTVKPQAKNAAKPAVKKPALSAKKPAAAKAAPAAKAVVAKRPAPPLKPVKKGAPPAAPAQDLSKKTVKTANAPALKTPAKTPAKIIPKAPAKPAEPKKPRFNAHDLDLFKVELLAMRDRITGQSGSMRNDALQRSDEINPEEDGTDAFMRLQTLEQVSSQQQIISNIDESLRSIEKGTYGVCDNCGELINKPRLSVLPFAKNCIKCQSEMERSRRTGGRR